MALNSVISNLFASLPFKDLTETELLSRNKADCDVCLRMALSGHFHTTLTRGEHAATIKPCSQKFRSNSTLSDAKDYWALQAHRRRI